MPTTAKICGLTTTATLDAALGGGASHVGFVFFPASPRHLTFDVAAGLAGRVPDHVQRVGVFVDPDDQLLEAAVRAGTLDAIQLHRTAPARVAAIRAKFDREVWAAVAIKARGDVDKARDYAGAATLILYDAKTPDEASLPGGMGLRFDWSCWTACAIRCAGRCPAGWMRQCRRGDPPHRRAVGRCVLRRRERAGRQGYGQDRRLP